MEKTLNDERVLELEREALKKAENDPWRLKFHLMPISGWLNDPNGLSERDGTNHIFFQYTPQATHSGLPNCWGHYKTDDFLTYEYLLPAIYPEHGFDKNGTHSGSAIELDDSLRAYYTGSVKHPGDYDYIREGREQNLVLAEDYDATTGKFKTVERLLTNEDYPEGLTLHVRDPKVFKRGEDFVLLLGARDDEDRGLVLVFESKDGRDWKFVSKIQSEDELGYMWECPDLVTIGDEDFLIMSPQGMESVGDDFQNIYQSGYTLVEDFDENPKPTEFYELDKGFDFYAPQTYVDEDGRRILIGWMGLPDVEYEYPTEENDWIHALTIPRILTTENGKLVQTPIPELEKLRLDEMIFKLGDEPITLEVPETFELILEKAAESGSIIIRDGCEFSWKDGLLELSFTGSEDIKKAGAGRDVRRARVKKLERVQLFVDTSSIEIFINDGEVVFSTRYFPEADKNTLKIKSDGSDIRLFELGSFTIKRGEEIIF